MRAIGQIESESAAQRLSDFLYVQRIPNQIEPGSAGHWELWVHSDDDLAVAAQWLETFQKNPNDPQFQAGHQASTLRSEEEKEQEEYRKKVKTRGQLFRRFSVYGVGPLSALLMATSVLVFFLTDFSNNFDKVHQLFFSEVHPGNLAARLLGSPEIHSGEIWRLITPIFLHFNFIHIFFNMLWMRDLGGMIETLKGTRKLLLLVIVSAAISNWAQYVVSGNPLFGGMSGVVYALFGYVWMNGKYHPGSGLYLHKQTVTMMLIWLVVCFTGLLGPIANFAHLGGLVTGVVWGFAETRRI